jgi:hypothetical protein
MKFLFSLALLVSASVSFAQSVTAAQVCQKVASANASNGTICAQLIARNVFDQGALNVAFRSVDGGSSYAIEVLKVAANRRFDINGTIVCEKVVAANSSNVAPCMTAIADMYVDSALSRVALAALTGGTSYAVAVLKAGANATFFQPIADICVGVAQANPANASVCIQVIADKTVLNGAEAVCRTSLSSGTSYAIDCLRNVVVDYAPVPVPTRTTVAVDLMRLQDLRRDLMKTRNLLDRGMIENARRSLDDSVRSVEDLLAAPQI